MRKILIAAAVLVVLAGGGGGGAAWLLSRGGHTTKESSTTAAVKRGDITVTDSAPGSVEPLSQRAVSFGASGTVATLKVAAGDSVKSGEVLATLDTAGAEDAVTSAESALNAAQDSLATAEAQPTTTTAPASTAGGSQAAGGGSQTSAADNLMRAQQSVNNDELTLKQAEAALDGTSIMAPASGRVLSVSGAIGDTVNSGGSGFIVMSVGGGVEIQADFSEADVALLKIGQKATVTLADHPDTKYAATVTQIDPAGTTSDALVRFGVRLTFTAAPSNLLIGQSATVAVTTASAADALYVPAAAVSTNPAGQQSVTVRDANGDHATTVGTGLEGDQGVQIVSGLSEGQTVVIPG